MVCAVAEVQAETLRVEYATFYSHVRKIDKEETQALQFAFGLKHIHQDRLCTIDKAHIHTEKKQIPLSVDTRNRFTIPAEKALKLAKAEVVLEMGDAMNQCDISVQLETRPEFLKRVYQSEDLQAILANYQAFFDNMGSFLSFMMPSAIGLKVQLANNASALAGQHKALHRDNQILLSEQWLQTNEKLVLNQTPVRILALMDNES